MKLPNLFQERSIFLNSLFDFINGLEPKDFDKGEVDVDYKETSVISIDADWGHGKTTFLRHLEKKLIEEDFIVFKFDAWLNDFEKEPLSVFIQDLIPQIISANHEDFESLKKYKNKIATFLSTANSIIEFTTNTIPLIPSIDIIKSLKKVKMDKNEIGSEESEAIKLSMKKTGMKKLQEDFINDLNKITPESNKKIVILIDELDRCRPSFAIEFLERVKHLFNNGKYLFIFTICQKQLKESVKQIYGNAFEETGYFRRFFDYEFYLPEPQKIEVIEHLHISRDDSSKEQETINRFGEDCLFSISLIPHISLRDLRKARDFIKLVMGLKIISNFNENEKSYLLFGITVRFISKILFEDLYLNNKYRIDDHNYEFLDEMYYANSERCGDSEHSYTKMSLKDWLVSFVKAKPLPEEHQSEIGKYKKLILSSNNLFGNFYFYSNIGENFFFYTGMKINTLNNILIFGANQLEASEE